MNNTIGRIDYESMEENVKIDLKDKRILSLLSEDSRMPLTQIAKKVKLSRDAIDYRIKRLEKHGIILKFFPNLNYDKLGFYIFHIFLLIDEMDKEEQKKLLNYLKQHPNMVSIIEYSDRWDLELTVIARTLLEFDKIISDIAVSFPHIIIEKDKLEIIRRYNSTYLPPLFTEKPQQIQTIKYKKPIPAKFDETDIKILRILSQDCRISTYAIGKQLGLSADTVSYRIKNLVKEDVITNFTILVNLSKLKFYWYTFSIEMKMFDITNEEKFKAFLEQNHNIIRSAKTLGGWDLLLYLVVENPREFHKIVKDIKNVFANIVRNYDTWVAYKEHLYNNMPEVMEQQE